MEDIFEQNEIYEQPEPPQHRYEVEALPKTQLEPPVEKRGIPVWVWASLVIGAGVGAIAAWHFLNVDKAFPSETLIDQNTRAQMAQQAMQQEAEVELVEAEDNEPKEIIDLGGEAQLDVELEGSAVALTEALSALGEDLDCGYFNEYYRLAWDATEQGVNPLIPLRDKANNLAWDMNQIPGMSDLAARTDKATVTRERMAALRAVISVVRGDSRNETAPLCTYSTGDVAIAANIYLQRLDQLIEQQKTEAMP